MKHIGVVASATMVSRVLGLVRDMLTAAVFGTTALNSAFVTAFTLPNLFRLLLGEGALTAALNWYRAMGAGLAETPRTQVPTTFVWGENDQAIGRVPAEACGDFVDADYRFVELDGVGHWIPEQAADSLAEAIIVRART